MNHNPFAYEQRDEEEMETDGENTVSPCIVIGDSMNGQDGLEDDYMEADDSRPEATFEYVVTNFNRLRDSQLSDACYVRNLPWKIMVCCEIIKKMPRAKGSFLNYSEEAMKAAMYNKM